MHVRMIVVTARLRRIGRCGRIVVVVMRMTVVTKMRAMQRRVFQCVADAGGRGEGCVERNRNGEQEGAQKTHGAHYSRRHFAVPPAPTFRMAFEFEFAINGLC